MEYPKDKQVELATMGNDISFVTIGLGITADPNAQEIKTNSPRSKRTHEGP